MRQIAVCAEDRFLRAKLPSFAKPEVDNGANIYDSSALTNASTTSTNVNQANSIGQSSGSTTTLSGYKRGQNSQTDSTHAQNKTETSSSNKTLNASFNRTENNSEASTDNLTTTSSKTLAFRQVRPSNLASRPVSTAVAAKLVCCCRPMRPRMQHWRHRWFVLSQERMIGWIALSEVRFRTSVPYQPRRDSMSDTSAR